MSVVTLERGFVAAPLAASVSGRDAPLRPVMRGEALGVSDVDDNSGRTISTTT
jgi:hypothetical protein